MRTRTVLPVLVVAASVLHGSAAFAGYLVGGVGLIQRANCGLMHSAGYAEWHNTDGTINFSVPVQGQHLIYDNTSGVAIASRTYSSYGQYNNFIEGTGYGGSC